MYTQTGPPKRSFCIAQFVCPLCFMSSTASLVVAFVLPTCQTKLAWPICVPVHYCWDARSNGSPQWQCRNELNTCAMSCIAAYIVYYPVLKSGPAQQIERRNFARSDSRFHLLNCWWLFGAWLNGLCAHHLPFRKILHPLAPLLLLPRRQRSMLNCVIVVISLSISLGILIGLAFASPNWWILRIMKKKHVPDNRWCVCAVITPLCPAIGSFFFLQIFELTCYHGYLYSFLFLDSSLEMICFCHCIVFYHCSGVCHFVCRTLFFFFLCPRRLGLLPRFVYRSTNYPGSLGAFPPLLSARR